MEASSDRRTTPETLIAELSAIEPRIPEMGCRVFPSSFNPKDPDLLAFPRPIHWQWASCERILRFFGAQTVMTRLPHFWQLESPIHACCRNIGAPIFINEPENLALGAAAIVSASVDAIISEASVAAPFVSFLLERDVPLPALWLLIHKADAREWTVPLPLTQNGITVAQEVHLFPGVPVLEQCPVLASGKKSLFHVSDEYEWEMRESETLITSVSDDLFPLHRLLLPISIHTAGECACGKTTVEKRMI